MAGYRLEKLLGEFRDLGLHDGCRGDGRASALHGEVPRGEAGFGRERVQVSGHKGSGGTKIELPELGSSGEITPRYGFGRLAHNWTIHEGHQWLRRGLVGSYMPG